MKFGKITQNKGYYSVQGYSRSPISVSKAYMRFPINDYITSRTFSKIWQIIVQILDWKRPLFVFDPLWRLRATYAVHLRLIGKHV